MTLTLHILIWVLAWLVAAPLVVLSIQCLLGLLPARRRAAGNDSTMPSVAVLVPAHNEQGVISATLNSLNQALPEHGRVIVVADNCSDSTACVARDHGAAVIERRDTVNRGKGFALAAGLASMESDPPGIVIIVDADCTVTPTTLNDLAKTAQQSGRPVQGVYLLHPPDTNNTKAVVSAFAFMVKNQARPRGMDLFNLPIPLTGSGMAFPYDQIKDANLATGNIVEDLALGLELAERGYGPVLCDAARITGALPSAGDDAVTQRTRWEHGYMSTLLTKTPALLIKGMTRFRPALVAAAIDLAVPPLSLLVLGAFAAMLPALVIGWRVGSFAPLCMIACSLGLAGLVLVMVWAVYARSWLPGWALAAIPGYILWKLPIYLKFVKGREKNWVRTERDSAPGQAHGSPGNGTSGG